MALNGAGSPMHAEREVDLLVVGAGILGLATAWQARRRGRRVAVIERHACCIGASVRNFGFVTVSGQGPAEHWRRARASRDAWDEIAPQAGIPVLQRGTWVLAQRDEAAALLEAFTHTEMGQGCALLDGAQARAACPALQPGAALLYSPHERRVESREAIPRLTRWLEAAQGVRFHWQTSLHAVDLPRVHTSAGVFRAARCIVCPGHALGSLPPEWLTAGPEGAPDIRICTLQMLRIAPARPLHLPAVLMSDLSLLRYGGFATLPQAAALGRRLARERPAHLQHGVHVIVAQSADGSLVVGDSHVYGDAEAPFACTEVEALILDELHRLLDLPGARVTERWTGSYASGPAPVWTSRPAPGLAIGIVTSGTGASTAFAFAQELVDSVAGG